MVMVQRADVADAIREVGYAISIRGFLNSTGKKILAIDTAPEQLLEIRAFILGRFPELTVDVISREPYATGKRLILSCF